METLRSEFRAILTRQTNRVHTALFADRSSTAFSSTITDTFSYELQDDEHIDEVYDLRRIIERLNSAGNVGDCVEFYRSSRKLIVDAKFRHLGVGDFRSLEWEMLAPKIKLWIRAARVCFEALFIKEKKLCEQIFSGLGNSTSDECFIGIVKESALQLINFAEGVSSTRPSFLKLFEILDLYLALFNVLPGLNSIFHSKLSESVCVRIEAARTVDLLAELVRNMLSLFENSVLHEQLNSPVSGGTIHPLTKYAVSYIRRIADYKEALTQLITSKPTSSVGNYDDMEFLEVPGKSPLVLHLIWIIISLKFNLEAKSKHYQDVSLGHLFLMNNVRYIIQRVEGSSVLQEMIGRDYIRKLGEYILQEADSYNRSTWDRVLYCLRGEGLYSGFFCSLKLSKATLKDRFKSFNATFDEVCQTQSTWLVLDSQLRGQLHQLILKKLTPAYMSFLDQFRSHIETEKHPERYIKYSVQGLENAVCGLFVEH